QWKIVSSASSTVQHAAYAVTFDPSGNAIAAGMTGDALDLGGGLKGPGGFLVAYDSSGTFQWEYGPFANTTFRKVRTKSNGHVVAIGNFSGTEDFGGGKLNAGTYRAVVLVEVDTSGSFVRAQSWTGGDQLGYALAIDGWDDVFIAGNFSGTIDF